MSSTKRMSVHSDPVCSLPEAAAAAAEAEAAAAAEAEAAAAAEAEAAAAAEALGAAAAALALWPAEDAAAHLIGGEA